MAKSWRDIELLDYKERQVRRRSQKTRELEQVLTGHGSEGTRLKRLTLGGFGFLLVLAVGIVAYQQLQRVGTGSSAYRSALHAGEVSGTVEISSSTTGWEKLEPGAAIPSGTNIRTGPDGKAELSTFLPGSRVLLFPGSHLYFDKVQLPEMAVDSAAFTFEMETGELVLDFPEGVPLTKLVLPLVNVYTKKVRYKARVSPEENRLFVAKFAAQVEDRSDSKNKTILPAEHRLVSRPSAPLPKPEPAKDLVLREQWH